MSDQIVPLQQGWRKDEALNADMPEGPNGPHTGTRSSLEPEQQMNSNFFKHWHNRSKNSNNFDSG